MTEISSRMIEHSNSNTLQGTSVLGISLNYLSHSSKGLFSLLQCLMFNFLQYFN